MKKNKQSKAAIPSNKILAHLDRLQEWAEGKNPPPITVDLNLTNRCNNNCPQCIGERQPLVDLKDPQRITKELADFGVKAITFSGGGEPLLHPEFVSCVQLAHKLGIDVGVLSNGAGMTKKIAEGIKPYCQWIRISFTADGPKMHAEIHGVKGLYGKTLQNIKTLVGSSGKAVIGIGYLTGRETVKGMLKAARVAKKLKVDYIQFRPFVFDSTPIDEEIHQCRKLETNTFKVLVSEQKYEEAKERGFRNFPKCFAQQFFSVITATGEMYVCCYWLRSEKHRLGNIYQQSIQEIWNSERRKKVIRNIDLKECKKQIPICKLSSTNQILWEIKQRREEDHKNFL